MSRVAVGLFKRLNSISIDFLNKLQWGKVYTLVLLIIPIDEKLEMGNIYGFIRILNDTRLVCYNVGVCGQLLCQFCADIVVSWYRLQSVYSNLTFGIVWCTSTLVASTAQIPTAITEAVGRVVIRTLGIVWDHHH